MATLQQTIRFDNAYADVFSFSVGNGVSEHHLMIHVRNPLLAFKQQVEAIDNAFSALREQQLNGAVAVFKRYFLSDAANQADYIVASDFSGCALSVIQQPPLDGTKVALWVYMQTGMTCKATENGLYECKHGQYRHLWGGSAHNLAANSEYQTRLLLNEYVMQLIHEGCKLADNCIRTWYFVNDTDLNYGGMVRARNQVFFTQGLNHDSHFIASTGIGGRQADTNVLVQMDSYAIDGIKPDQVYFLYAQSHLNRTSDYGVSFERGTYVQYGDRRHVFISGTASINNKGMIMFPGDVIQQTHRMLENVETLLKEADCSFEDVGPMIVYLRDMADYNVVKNIYDKLFNGKSYIIVNAPVCRQEWLIEMECMAIKDISDSRFQAL